MATREEIQALLQMFGEANEWMRNNGWLELSELETEEAAKPTTPTSANT